MTFTLAIVVAVALAIAALAWLVDLAIERRYYTPRDRKGIVGTGEPGDPERVVTIVVIEYEAHAIGGIGGHRYAVRAWFDNRLLGGGWAPGELMHAQDLARTLSKVHGWAQLHELRMAS